jgi:DNA repair protein RadC
MKTSGSGYVIDDKPRRVHDIPERLRPREEMDRLGVRNVSDDVLIAVLLRSGVRNRNVIELARALLQQYGSLTALAGAPVEELADLLGMGPVKARVLAAALELGKRLGEEGLPAAMCVREPRDAVRLVRDSSRGLQSEVFWVIHLDAKNRVKGRAREISRGTLDASLVHPREVFRDAIRSSCAAVVLAHNHPSGDPTPSAEDIRITRQLVEAGKIVDIKVLDHVIVGRPTGEDAHDYASLREGGVVNFD